MKRYETFIIVDPDVSDEDRNQFLDRLKEVISDQQSILVLVDEWGSRKLAYEIKKKSRGYYVRLDYCGTGALVDELERLFRIDDRIMKYMTVLLSDRVDMEQIQEEIAEAEAKTAKAAQEAAQNITRPGTRVSELFTAAVEVARKGSPEYQRTHIGHGIGLELYEPPSINPASDIILEEGMVFNVEPPYYELGLGGFQVEDTVVVTDKGFRFLTSLDRGLMKA